MPFNRVISVETCRADVKVEGKNVPRLADIMLQNKQSSPNTPPFPLLQPPLVVIPFVDLVQDQPENGMKSIEPGE